MGKILSFRRQMVLGFFILIAGFLSATLLRQMWLCNAAGAVYGALFFLHPVYPDRTSVPLKKMKFYIRITAAAIILISLVTRYEL